MGGGLMQLVAYGAQDVYLTGNPQITFFKVVYRRHTNFSMEAIRQTFNGSESLNSKVSATISRNGDLIHKMYLQTTIDVTTGNTAGVVDGNDPNNNADPNMIIGSNNIGHLLIKEVEIEIGGQRIDKHYSAWLDIWSELTLPKGKEDGYNKMIDIPESDYGTQSGVKVSKKLYIPLQFWFCRNPGLALPLIALQYHEVKVNIQFETESAMTFTSTIEALKDKDGNDIVASVDAVAPSVSISNTSLWVDYIYLDTDERRRFAQVSHEYLIEQLQFTGSSVGKGSTNGTSNKFRLNYNHPVKEIVWVNRVDNLDSTLSVWNEWSAVKECNLQLNGHDRMAARDGSYFSLVQPYQHHTNIPATTTGSQNINVYSFALKPEDHQPSGTCNMSRIDNASLNVSVTNKTKAGVTGVDATTVNIYAVNYNVLRIMGGMGGLAYSN